MLAADRGVLLKSIALFGGTFDPVHYGHLRTALEIKEALHLDEMRMLPCHTPAHRETPQSGVTRRLEMLELAVANEPGLVCDDIEIRRGGISYMADTLAQMRLDLGESMSISLVVGMDSFLTLPEWHNWQQILQLAHIIVAARPGSALPDQGVMGKLVHARETVEMEDVIEHPFGRIIVQHMTPLDISATRIREIIGGGQSPRYLLPDPVWDYIKSHQLYGPIEPRAKL